MYVILFCIYVWRVSNLGSPKTNLANFRHIHDKRWGGGTQTGIAYPYQNLWINGSKRYITVSTISLTTIYRSNSREYEIS